LKEGVEDRVEFRVADLGYDAGLTMFGDRHRVPIQLSMEQTMEVVGD
jgi:hypothetical protein